MVHVRWGDHGVLPCWYMDYTGRLVDTASDYEEAKSRHRLDRSNFCNSVLGFTCLRAGVSSLDPRHPHFRVTHDTLIASSQPAIHTSDMLTSSRR